MVLYRPYMIARSARSGMLTMNIGNQFDKPAQWTAAHAGRASTFCIALAIMLFRGGSSQIYAASETWQPTINTGTAIVMFLMAFLIQNTQNSDFTALRLMLDELIRAEDGARNRLLGSRLSSARDARESPRPGAARPGRPRAA